MKSCQSLYPLAVERMCLYKIGCGHKMLPLFVYGRVLIFRREGWWWRRLIPLQSSQPDDIFSESKRKKEVLLLPTIRWRKGELIGCGAFGRVYMGVNLDSGKLLAVKEVGFKTGDHKRQVVFIGGHSDGFLATEYLEPLAIALDKECWSLVQFLFSSSNGGYGTSSLKEDATELDQLISYLINKEESEGVVLLGHSTGCQFVQPFCSCPLLMFILSKRQQQDGLLLFLSLNLIAKFVYLADFRQV